MSTEIWISFNYGGYSLVFSKTFELPFTPFYGMWLTDGDNQIEFSTNDYNQTVINYDIDKGEFEINLREYWKRPVSDETIDDVIETYKDWKRRDITNIKELKELMKLEHERRR